VIDVRFAAAAGLPVCERRDQAAKPAPGNDREVGIRSQKCARFSSRTARFQFSDGTQHGRITVSKKMLYNQPHRGPQLLQIWAVHAIHHGLAKIASFQQAVPNNCHDPPHSANAYPGFAMHLQLLDTLAQAQGITP